MQSKPTVRSIDVLRLAVKAHRDPKTVVRVIEGGGNALSRSAIEDAARELGIALPDSATSNGVRVRAT